MDPGSVLSAGFLKELGRSHRISFKTIPGLWLASLGSWYLQLCGGCAVLCCALGAPWGFQVAPSVHLGTSYPPLPTALAVPPAAPTSWEGFASAYEPGAKMAGCVQGNGKVQACAVRSRPKKGCLASVCSWRCSGQNLICPSFRVLRHHLEEVHPMASIVDMTSPAEVPGLRGRRRTGPRVSPHPSGPWVQAAWVPGRCLLHIPLTCSLAPKMSFLLLLIQSWDSKICSRLIGPCD